MQTTVAQAGSMSASSSKPAVSHPWLMLLSRSVLFILFQGLIALILVAAGTKTAWDEAASWWPFMAILTNFVSLYLLVRVFSSEGKRFFDILRFSRETWKTDLLWFIGFSLIGMPIAAAPREPLAAAIFGDASIATNMLFRPLPTWAFIVSFLFPLTIWFAEHSVHPTLRQAQGPLVGLAAFSPVPAAHRPAFGAGRCRQAVCVAWSWFRQNGVIPSRPPAGNAYRAASSFFACFHL